VWAGIHADGLFGLYFFDDTVTKPSYLEMLEDLRGEIDNDPQLQGILNFMQDGTPSNYALQVPEFSDNYFGD